MLLPWTITEHWIFLRFLLLIPFTMCQKVYYIVYTCTKIDLYPVLKDPYCLQTFRIVTEIRQSTIYYLVLVS